MTRNDDTLPWQRPDPRKSEMVLDVSTDYAPNVFKVRKQGPNEPDPGWYVGYHNGVRISDRRYEHMAAALREATTYFYSLPQFAASGQGKALEAIKRIGADDYKAGVAIQDGMRRYDGQAQTNWIAGWLTAYGNQFIARMGDSVIATARANEQLEADIRLLEARNMALVMVFEYAMTKGDDTAQFLTKFIANKGVVDDDPDWQAFRQRKEAELRK